LYARAQRGEVLRRAENARREPDGTQIGFFHNLSLSGQLLAMVHHYVPADAHRPEDPKLLRDGGRLIAPAHDENDPPCAECARWGPLARGSVRRVRWRP
jgi:hypothetical protein